MYARLAQTVVPDQALNDLTPYANWQLLLGIILPLVIALITKRDWSRGAKSGAMLAVSAIATVVGLYLNGTLYQGGMDVVGQFLKVCLAVISFYYGILQPLGITDAIHDATG